MSDNNKGGGLQWVLADDVSASFSFRRATVVAIYFSFPSNQNAHEGGGTTLIPQKIIPWGDKAEPRVYISPFTLKRNIRNYWVKAREKVAYRERQELIRTVDKNQKVNPSDGVPADWLEYIDLDLFGWVSAEKGVSGEKGSSVARPGPINTWGAVSLEPLHDFVDFNTSVLNVKEESREKGGGIFNRQISKEFYFTSFFINPDLVGTRVDFSDGTVNVSPLQESIKRERIKAFFEALPYALQKESGPRDRPTGVFVAVAIGDKHYPTFDKSLFQKLEVNEGGNKVKIPWNAIRQESEAKGYSLHILYLDSDFVESDEELSVEDIEKIVKELFPSSS